jgi:TPR repeat protein
MQRAAEQNFVPAMPLLASFFERGLGVPKNLEDAKRWYRLAAERGDANAKAALARLSPQP